MCYDIHYIAEMQKDQVVGLGRGSADRRDTGLGSLWWWWCRVGVLGQGEEQ